MKIKRFFAKDIRAALDEIKITLGPDAIIMSNKNVEGGVEIVAAVDEDNNAVIEKPEASNPSFETTLENQQSTFATPEKTDTLENNNWDTTGRLDKEFNDAIDEIISHKWFHRWPSWTAWHHGVPTSVIYPVKTFEYQLIRCKSFK